MRDIGDDSLHLRRQPLAERDVLRGDVDGVDLLADEARVVERPERPAVAGTEIREYARRRPLRRLAQEWRHPLGEEVARVLEIFDRRAASFQRPAVAAD